MSKQHVAAALFGVGAVVAVQLTKAQFPQSGRGIVADGIGPDRAPGGGTSRPRV